METAGSERPQPNSPEVAPEPRPPPGLRAPASTRTQSRTEPQRSLSRAARRGGVVMTTVRLKREEEPRARRHQVLSDSENEEPITRRISNICSFIRKTSTALSGVAPRSRSCTDPEEDEERLKGKLKVLLQPALLDPVGALTTAGVLLSSENSRSASVPILPPRRRLAWSAVVPPQNRSQSRVPGRAQSRVPVGSERSVSPDSNDSISEELNHFKPIVCSPCTPPKRLEDGRLLQPRVIKATPRNLRELPQTSQGVRDSEVVLQKWRQIELDRQMVSAATRAGGGRCTVSVATHTSPMNDSALSMETRNRLQDHSLGLTLGSTSKRKQKPKRLEAKRCRRDDVANANANCFRKHGGTANVSVGAQERADAYFLRSTRSTRTNQSTERGRSLRRSWTNESTDRGRSLRSSRRRHRRP